MKTSLLLAVAFFALASLGAAQQELVDQKSKSGEAFGEKALKAKTGSKTVGGGYRYGKKKPPTEMRESKNQTVLKEPPMPAKAGGPKKKDDGKPITAGDVTTAAAVAVALPFLLIFGLGVGEQVHKEAAVQQMFGGKP